MNNNYGTVFPMVHFAENTAAHFLVPEFWEHETQNKDKRRAMSTTTPNKTDASVCIFYLTSNVAVGI